MNASTDLDYAIELYVSGLSVQAVSAATGVGRKTLYRSLKGRGVMRTRGEAARQPHVREARGAISRELWRDLTPEERISRTAAAHAAVRGTSRTEDELERKARTRQDLLLQVSDDERRLADWLHVRGEGVEHQVAVGRYNADLVMSDGPRIAVEVNGGGWHAYGEHGARLVKRSRKVLDSGFHLVIVWAPKGVTEGAADELVAYADALRRNPSPIRQYRVIRGNGKFIAGGAADDDDLVLIPPRTGRGYRSDLFD